MARLPRSVETINYCTDCPGMSGIQSLLLSCGAGGGGGGSSQTPGLSSNSAHITATSSTDSLPHETVGVTISASYVLGLHYSLILVCRGSILT